MADLDINEEVVVLGGVDADVGYTHDTITVTLTATMKQGSILDSAGAELALAGAASAVAVIDDLTIRRHFDDYEVGDSLAISVAKRGLILNEDVCTFTDGLIDAAGKAALEVSGNKFSAPNADATLV